MHQTERERERACAFELARSRFNLLLAQIIVDTVRPIDRRRALLVSMYKMHHRLQTMRACENKRETKKSVTSNGAAFAASRASLLRQQLADPHT